MSEKETGACAEWHILTRNTTLSLGYLILKTMADHIDDISTHERCQSAFCIVLKQTKTAGFRRDTRLCKAAQYFLTETIH